ERYFPTAARQRFRTRLARHPLRREIVAGQVTNSLVNRAGTTFAFRLSEETGATGADIARAFAVAREVFGLHGVWAEVAALARRVGHLESLFPALDLVDVSAGTGIGFEEVSDVYFAIDERLELHALRARIAALPREERWEALARRALWEDLQSEHRALTA